MGERMTARERVLEACIALVDCDDSDPEAYRACWERLRAAATDWLNPGRKDLTREQIGNAFRAFEALRDALSTQELAKRVGVCHRAGQHLVQTMRAYGLPVHEIRQGTRLAYQLDGSPLKAVPKPKQEPEPKKRVKPPSPQLTLLTLVEHDEVAGLGPDKPISEWLTVPVPSRVAGR